MHRIFESLNNTGLQLSQGDLLRNYLFMRMPERAETVYSTVWRPLEQTLGTDNLEMLFWLDLAQSDDRAKMTDIYTAQVARLDRLTSEDEFEAEVRRFARLGDLLRLILDPALENDEQVRLRLQHLKDWDTTTVRPALLLLLQRRADGAATSQQIAAAMLYIESFLIRRLLLGKATNANNRILARAAIEIGQASEVATAVHRYLSSGRKYYGTDDEIRESVATIPFYLNGRPLQRKLILKWLEESFGSQEPVDVTQATIEHVLPQTSTESWIAELQTDLRDDEDVEEVYQELLHTLGNLTLTGYNGTLGNRPFAQKRSELTHSGIRLSQSITCHGRWSRPEILNRAEQLADRIIGVWPGPTSDVTPVGVEAKWQHLRRAVAAIPAGYWTSYSDIATLIGSSAQPVGAHLAAAGDLRTAHRVLKARGYVSPGFRWHDETRTDDPLDVLAAEGLSFDESGFADPGRRLTAEKLAVLLGETITDDPDPEDADTA